MGMLVVPAGPETAIAWPAHQATVPGFAGSAAIWGDAVADLAERSDSAHISAGATTVSAARPKLTKCAPS